MDSAATPGKDNDMKENHEESLQVTLPGRNQTGRPPTYSKEIMEKVCEYIRKGLTYEKAGEILGISPKTIQSWQNRYPAFADAIKKARRELEVFLLESITNAGEKSWQARAWMLERNFGYAQPSARVDVKQEIQHGLSPTLANLLAGYNSKKAQVIDSKQIVKSESEVIELQDVKFTKYNNHCATNDAPAEGALVLQKRKRHKPMRRKKLRQDTTTPDRQPPSADKNVDTPLSNCDTK